jgi:class 3 adenylate cyclase/predicted ATPase
MYCDLVDSVGLSTRLDPEDLSQVIVTYQSTCLGPIKQYGGHVARYLGDALLVFFGYPVAHEDDAERAIHASLEILELLAPLNDKLKLSGDARLKLRIGIATGMVVVGDVNTEGVMEPNAVVGEAANLAARLQTFASPNTIVVSSLTRQLAAERFEYRDLGVHALKGFNRPVALYEVVGGRSVSRFEAAARGSTHFVGRQDEYNLLNQSWNAAVHGEGRVVLISGEAGIGKSRLVQEFRKAIEGNYFDLHLQCSPYYQNSALHPMIERLETELLLKSALAPRDGLDRLKTKLTDLGLGSDDRVACLALLLGIPSDKPAITPVREPEKLKRLTFETLLALCLRETAGQPMLLVVEDVHWCDPSTLEFLYWMAERLRKAKAMMVATFRPEFRPPWGGGANVVFLPLAKLSPTHSKELVAGLAGGESLPESVLQEILVKCDGVPLFAEELARSVIDGGTADDEHQQAARFSGLSIPSSLQDTLIARLDRLPSAKKIAQLAALLGRSFDYEMLEAVLPGNEVVLQSALSDLVADGLFIQRGTPPSATYEFKHGLVQDAAYQLLLKRTRQEHHSRIAEVLEQRFAQRAQFEPEILAHHWTEAQQATKAIHYWVLAGQRASERSALREAVSHFQKGLGLVEEISDQNERKRIELEMQLPYAAALMATEGPGSPQVQAAYTRALSLCDELPQSPMHFAAGWGSWRIAMDFQTGRERADRLLKLAHDIDNAELALQAHHCQWATLFMLGHQEACCGQIEKGLALYDPKAHFSHAGIYGGHDAKVCALGEASLSFCLRGFPASALKYGTAALEWARQLDHPGSIAHALDYMVMLSRYLRDPRAILRHAENLIRYSEQQDLTDHGVKGRFFRGYALTQFEQLEWGLGEMRECMEIELRIGTQEDFPVYFEMLAEVAARAGQYEESLRAIQQAGPVVEQRGIRYWSAELHRRRGEVLLAQSGTTAALAEEEFGQALAISQDQGAKLLELRALASLVRLRGRSGIGDRYYDALNTVVSEFPEPHEIPDLKDARAELTRR